jgi:hypothetical protein
MIKSELYLIIFWEKADIDMDFARRIIKQERFDCELVKGHLSSVEQLKFIKQLYYKSVTNFDQKLERVGASKIIVGIVHDSAPDYQLIHTTRGFSNVNKNILELKKKLRSYAKVNDGVHLSDTMEEANHNLFLSFSKTYFELEQTWRNIEFCPKKVENISDILSLLNVSTDYVVQRNFQRLNETTTDSGDIDLLVRDVDAAALVIGAEPFVKDGIKLLYKVYTSSREIIFDLHDLEDSYFPQSWGQDILRRKVISECNRYFRPSDQDLIYMTAYHALFHKFDLKPNYLEFLKEKSSNLTDTPLNNWNDILSSLARFLKKNRYEVSVPKSKSIKLNPFHYIASRLTDNQNISRKSFLPEHHARNFIKMINENPEVIYQKSNALAEVTVLTSKIRPFDMLICKIVKVKDVKFAPYLLNEYFQLELYGNKYAPKVFSYFFDDGKYHIIMERVNGHRLDHLLSANRDFIKINKNIILNNLSAAESLLKNKGIMHRDIRETNIFITPQVEVKLIDFGLSCSVFDKQAPIPSTLANSGDDATDFLRLKGFVARII